VGELELKGVAKSTGEEEETQLSPAKGQQTKLIASASHEWYVPTHH
jgi:hypothetical protein